MSNAEKPKKDLNIKTLRQLEQFREDYGHRCIYKAMGFTTEELSLPRIAVVNSYGEGSPGHSHLRSISDGIKAGIRMAGGMPFEINVIGPCTMLGKTVADAANYDMPQREAILSSIESALHVGWCDGWVGIGSCDKIIPGMVLAALRLNRPFLFMGGGQMLPSDYQGKRFGFVEGQEIMFKELQSSRDDAEQYEKKLEEITDCFACSAGACSEMSTGNTLALLTEAMGFSLPYTSTSIGVSAEKIWQSKEAGKKIVELANKQIKPSDILTFDALKNAIAVDMAVCGGTNSLIHLQSYAHETGLPCTLDTWDEISRKVPALCAVAPSGPYILYDLHKAGGVPAVMKRIRQLLNEDCLTVTAESVKKNLESVEIKNQEVIRPIDQPIWPDGAKTILRGNLAPRGAVTRHTVVENKDLLQHTFRARVFDSVEKAIEGILSDEGEPIMPGDALVVRYVGPRGGPAMPCCLSVVRALKIKQVEDIAIVTDGRFSGFTKSYLAVGHICPEAQVGGPLCTVREGDRIRIDLPNREINLEISEAEMATRKAEWKLPATPPIRGVITLYAKNALQADQGAGWPVTMDDFDDA